jgi:hypothetical protein
MRSLLFLWRLRITDNGDGMSGQSWATAPNGFGVSAAVRSIRHSVKGGEKNAKTVLAAPLEFAEKTAKRNWRLPKCPRRSTEDRDSLDPSDLGPVLEPDTRIGSPYAEIRERLARFFTAELGFGPVNRVHYTDGVRVLFENEVAHFCSSGNADELRVYAVAVRKPEPAPSPRLALPKPNGILRSIEHAAAQAESGATR